MPLSRITPEWHSMSTAASYSSAEANCGGGPALGQRAHSTLRQLAWPVSALR